MKHLITAILIFSSLISCSKDKPAMSAIEFKIPKNDHSGISGCPAGSLSGYAVYDTEKNIIVRQHNMENRFIPASVTKLFTALYALSSLDPDLQIKTELKISGDISDSTLNGNIYLVGHGDCTLTVNDLIKMVLSLQEAGIKKVTGNLVYCSGDVTQKYHVSGTMPENAYYNSGYGSLNLDLNKIRIIKDRGMVYSVPSLSNIVIGTKEAVKSGVYSKAEFIGRGETENWYYPENRIINGDSLPVKDTGKYTAMVFLKLCKNMGIDIRNTVSGSDEGKKTISTVESKKLIDIVTGILKYSNNFKAETIGSIASGSAGTESSIEGFLKNNFKGINWKGLVLKNYSGLTTENRCTPVQVLAVLRYLDLVKPGGRNLEYILPVASYDGTLLKRFRSPSYSYRVFAKTGTIYYASGLAGIFYGRSGKKYLFCAFINDNEKRLSYNAKEITDYRIIRSAGEWTRSAEKSIDNFIKKNIDIL